MSKRIFILIVVLMSISLIGIISVQVYWIKDAIENKRRQFKTDVTIALGRTAEKIQEQEEFEDRQHYRKFIENNRFRAAAEINNYIFEQIDTTSKEKFTFSTTTLEEKFKIPTGILKNDSTIVKRITGKQNFMRVKLIGEGKDFKEEFSDENYTYFGRFDNFENFKFKELSKQRRKLYPIHKRITSRMLSAILKDELYKRNINQGFKFGVYDDGLATAIKSGYFKIKSKDNYSYPLFAGEDDRGRYKLYVSFPDERKNLLSGMMWVLLLSLLFIGVIVLVFSASLYQLVRQKKISEIKTDFINNMTHEFKTPIATINLALDAIKNPKIINDEEKVKRYIQMIREENKRMHGQVESVLRISRLEKKQIDISKETVQMHDIIEEAVEHIQLLLSNKNGNINLHFKAIANAVLGNHFHLTNVVINMLENAIKYSENAPSIKVFTESTNKFFVFKVKDEGIGMSKNAQKYIFDKFYREHKGNVHNVKGHGLGLSYVKEIIDNHQGTVYVESEKDKGSTFTVKLPLI